jgi:hypothetical protein
MLPVSDFGKNARMKDGLHYTCKVCRRIASKKWKKENAEYVKSSSAKYYVNNKDRIDVRNKAWKDKNPDKVSSAGKENYEKNKDKVLSAQKEYRTNNRAKLNAKAAKERADKKKATPKWLTQIDKEFMEVTYAMAKVMSEMEQTEYHVDHIVPLNGEKVSGLHVPRNLQVIPKFDNLSKGNRLMVEN